MNEIIVNTEIVPVATHNAEQIFYVLNPPSEEDDGVVLRDGKWKFISFWPYVMKKSIRRIVDTDFHHELWDVPKDAEKWRSAFIDRTSPLPAKQSIRNAIISVNIVSTNNEPAPKTGEPAIKSAVPMRMEPYDPDAIDGDNDGLVQDRTIWERPAGTRILNDLGEELAAGFTALERPQGTRIVDNDGNDVDYKPKTPDEGRVENRLTPGDLTMPSSLRDRGMNTVDDAAHPERGELDRREADEKRRVEAEKEAAKAQKERVAESKKKDDFVAPEDTRTAPGVSDDTLADVGMREPQKPKRPIEPLPPAFHGKARDWADDADGDYDKFLARLNREGYVVLDYETTGWSDGATNRPVQIGAVRIRDGKVVERFNVFVNPDESLRGWSAENLKDADGNPLTDDWLSANGLGMADAHAQLAAFMGDSIIVAHNLKFDFDVMNRMMRESETDFTPAGMLDTLKLAREMMPKGDGKTFPASHKLSDLAKFFNMPLGGDAHRADADAEATGLILQRALRMGSTRKLDGNAIRPDFQEAKFVADFTDYERAKSQYDADMKAYKKALADYERIVSTGGRDSLGESRDSADLENVKPDRVRSELGERGMRDFEKVSQEFALPGSWAGSWEESSGGGLEFEIDTPNGPRSIPMADVVAASQQPNPEQAMRELFFAHGVSNDPDSLVEGLLTAETALTDLGLEVQVREGFAWSGDWLPGTFSEDPLGAGYRLIDENTGQATTDVLRFGDLLKAVPVIDGDTGRIVGVKYEVNPDILQSADRMKSVAIVSEFDDVVKKKLQELDFEGSALRISHVGGATFVSVSAESVGLPASCPPMRFRVRTAVLDGTLTVIVSADIQDNDPEGIRSEIAKLDPLVLDVTPNADGGFDKEVLESFADSIAQFVDVNKSLAADERRRDYLENKFRYDDAQAYADMQKRHYEFSDEFIAGKIDQREYELLMTMLRMDFSEERAKRRRAANVTRPLGDIDFPIERAPGASTMLDPDEPYASDIDTNLFQEFTDLVEIADAAHGIDEHPLGSTQVTILPDGIDPPPEHARSNGWFSPRGPDGFPEILVNEGFVPDGEDPYDETLRTRLTFAHELGHRVDYGPATEVIEGTDGLTTTVYRYFSTTDNPSAVAFNEAYDEAFSDQIAFYGNSPLHNIPQGTQGRTYFQYFMMPEEKMARVYALWLADLSGDTAGITESHPKWNELVASRKVYPALEAMLVERGLALPKKK